MDDETLRLRVGEAIRSRRQALELSEEGFADSIGMHRAYYSSIERGGKNLTLSTIARVCAGLRCTIAELFKSAKV